MLSSWDTAQKGDFDDYLNKIAIPQVRELLTGYGPIALIWFDAPLHMTPERAQRFVNLVRETQPDCLINGRLQMNRRGFDYISMELETGRYPRLQTRRPAWNRGYRADPSLRSGKQRPDRDQAVLGRSFWKFCVLLRTAQERDRPGRRGLQLTDLSGIYVR